MAYEERADGVQGARDCVQGVCRSLMRSVPMTYEERTDGERGAHNGV